MATTTNYGWTTPDDTALVKDGASAIRLLGTSVDTTTKALNPSTTLGDIEYRSSTANTNTRLPLGTAGQVLKVNSGATAPEWATDATGMTNPLTTTGDTIYSSSGTTPARLGIGTTGQILTVAGGVPTWATAAAAGKSFSLLSTTNLSGSTTTVTGISNIDSLMILVDGASSGNSGANITCRFNSDSSAVYNLAGTLINVSGSYDPVGFAGHSAIGTTSFIIGKMSANAGSVVRGSVNVQGANSTGFKAVEVSGGGTTAGSDGQINYVYQGTYDGTSKITSVSIITSAGTFDAGTVYIYGSA